MGGSIYIILFYFIFCGGISYNDAPQGTWVKFSLIMGMNMRKANTPKKFKSKLTSDVRI